MPRTLAIVRPEHPLDAAILLFGTATNLARELGYSPSAIFMMRARGRVTKRAALAIERATAGQVTAEEILASNRG